ncbi:hypothetical protein AB1N83_013344 [Pleurotus pulmonarius]
MKTRREILRMRLYEETPDPAVYPHHGSEEMFLLIVEPNPLSPSLLLLSVVSGSTVIPLPEIASLGRHLRTGGFSRLKSGLDTMRNFGRGKLYKSLGDFKCGSQPELFRSPATYAKAQPMKPRSILQFDVLQNKTDAWVVESWNTI